MMSLTLGRLLGVLVAVLSASIALYACTDGTTPNCSGDPSPCGYEQPPEGGAASEAEGGG